MDELETQYKKRAHEETVPEGPNQQAQSRYIRASPHATENYHLYASNDGTMPSFIKRRIFTYEESRRDEVAYGYMNYLLNMIKNDEVKKSIIQRRPQEQYTCLRDALVDEHHAATDNNDLGMIAMQKIDHLMRNTYTWPE